MKQLIIRELKSNYKGLLFWSLGFLFLIVVGFAEYAMFIENGTEMASVFDLMPKVVQIMMGIVLPLETPAGYFACMFLFICLGAFLYSGILGANIVTKEETDKTAEFIFTKPIKRSEISTAKIIAAKINIMLISLIIWGSVLLVFGKNLKDASLITTVNLCMIGMIICQLIFFSIGFLLSGLTKKKSAPTLYITGVIFIAYFISVILLIKEITYLRFLTPFLYFDTVNVINNGLEIMYLFISLLIFIISTLIGYNLWNNRDLKI